MAPKKRKKPVKKIKFQLTRSAIAGIAVVCFCIFLWMFLVGVWAGQSLLYRPVNVDKISHEAGDSGKGTRGVEVIRLKVHKKKIKK